MVGSTGSKGQSVDPAGIAGTLAQIRSEKICCDFSELPLRWNRYLPSLGALSFWCIWGDQFHSFCRRSHQDGVVVSSLYSRRGFEAGAGSLHEWLELGREYQAILSNTLELQAA